MNFTFNAASAPASQTNIKMITVQTTDASSNVNIVLRAFASNVGENGINKKAW